MDPRCFNHWPWNQKVESESLQDLAHSEVYSKFFVKEQEVKIEVPKCMDEFVWTGIRFVLSSPDELEWYPLGIRIPTHGGLTHTIFIQYGKWNILPIAFSPEYIDIQGAPILKLQFLTPQSGKVELLAQKIYGSPTNETPVSQ
ncbi:MAG: hypothetical protein EBU82_10890 [Flavobacteriia bacterium]|nr:hypothetical protein [Flavobacteriia bacterium]